MNLREALQAIQNTQPEDLDSLQGEPQFILLITIGENKIQTISHGRLSTLAGLLTAALVELYKDVGKLLGSETSKARGARGAQLN